MNKRIITRSIIGITIVIIVIVVGILLLNVSTPSKLTVAYTNQALRDNTLNVTKTITGDAKTINLIWDSITSQHLIADNGNFPCPSPSFTHQYTYNFMFSTLRVPTRQVYVSTQGCGIWHTSGIFGWGTNTYCCASAELWAMLERLTGIPSPFS